MFGPKGPFGLTVGPNSAETRANTHTHTHTNTHTHTHTNTHITNPTHVSFLGGGEAENKKVPECINLLG